MVNSRQNELLEIYKLHARLADRVSQRREGANRLYVSLLVGLGVLLAALLRVGIGDASERLVLFSIGAFGAFLSISWFVIIQAHGQLNRAKFRVLQELEKQLVYEFFTLEDKERSGFWKLTTIEVTLPVASGILFLGLIVYSLVQ